jgi:hypothetical protein
MAKYEGRIQFYFTPTAASWLNQVEIRFELLTRKTQRGGSFASKDQLRSAIDAFVDKTNQNLAKGSALEIPLDGYQACSGSAAEGRMGKVL